MAAPATRAAIVAAEKKWTEDYYGQLVGGQITAFEVKREEDAGVPGWVQFWPVLTIEVPNPDDPAGSPLELKVEVSQDEEGNGPGFMFGLPDPRAQERSAR